MIDYDALMAREFPVVEHTYSSKDVALYALGLGVGSYPLDPMHLKATYENDAGFAVMPAMVNVLAYPGFWAMKPDTGLTWQKILHGEQSLTVHAPLSPSGTVMAQTRITGIVDKGQDKGALIYSERQVTDKQTGALLATVQSTMVARDDGGFGGPSGPIKPVHMTPAREPDLHHDFKTSDRAALIYRLSGDLNPLHADPEVARQVGFERPILHGLCTLGVVSWSLPAALREGDFTTLKHLQLRFSSPVYPGETIRTETWIDGDDISFRARVLERNVIVLNNGLARLN
jgi:acyl dehydratase